MKYIFMYRKQRKNLSDLVQLGILPKQVSEYTDADIGSIISIPYNDESGIITGPIEFEVVGVNHHKDINDPDNPTITLMSKNIIRQVAFDGKEPNNPLYDERSGEKKRQKSGNNRWAVSNIRQWLNSEGAANEWFTPQHEYDEAPTGDNVYSEYKNSGAYADEAGFLAGFSDEIKQHFATVNNITVLCNADKNLLSKDYEETEDKVFLPSYTEMGYGNIDENNPEGVHLDKKFIDDNSRIKIGGDLNYFWMRTPKINGIHQLTVVVDEGFDFQTGAYDGNIGVTPIIVLC